MTPYALPEATRVRLETLVDQIEAAPGRLVEMSEIEDITDPNGVLQSLPEGISEDDFIGILKLAMLTECATDVYAYEITTRARQYDALWLERFNENVWKPDEYTHAEPFKRILMGLGFGEEELEREMAETQAREFEHYGGDTPVHVSTFGMIQEYLTDHWHGLISNLLKPALPQAARMTARIKQRETLHTVWYRDFTAIQVEANPRFIDDVAMQLAHFRLPGNSLVPHLQPHAERWLPLMGADMNRVVRELSRLLLSTVGTPDRFGKMVFEMADWKGVGFGPLKPHHFDLAMRRFGDWGYGLVGEAILERTGLDYLYKRIEAPGSHGPVAKARATLRTWLAKQIPLSLVTA